MARVPTTIPFSIDWLPDGRMLVVSGPEALLLRQEPGGSLVTHADLSRLAGGWNEIVVDGRGNAYVNGSDFDFRGGGEFKPGIIALVAPDGSVRQVADGIAFPNGMVVTPDNATLTHTVPKPPLQPYPFGPRPAISGGTMMERPKPHPLRAACARS
jgi:sugar lactone lactonase YvrE